MGADANIAGEGEFKPTAKSRAFQRRYNGNRKVRQGLESPAPQSRQTLCVSRVYFGPLIQVGSGAEYRRGRSQENETHGFVVSRGSRDIKQIG
jgi:hypothetical protein